MKEDGRTDGGDRYGDLISILGNYLSNLLYMVRVKIKLNTSVFLSLSQLLRYSAVPVPFPYSIIMG